MHISERKLEIEDKQQLEILISDIEINLENELFWLPITKDSRENFFNDNWTYFIGAFNDNKLIAAVGLFLNKNEYGESQDILQLQNYKIAEIGNVETLK